MSARDPPSTTHRAVVDGKHVLLGQLSTVFWIISTRHRNDERRWRKKNFLIKRSDLLSSGCGGGAENVLTDEKPIVTRTTAQAFVDSVAATLRIGLAVPPVLLQQQQRRPTTVRRRADDRRRRGRHHSCGRRGRYSLPPSPPPPSLPTVFPVTVRAAGCSVRRIRGGVIVIVVVVVVGRQKRIAVVVVVCHPKNSGEHFVVAAGFRYSVFFPPPTPPPVERETNGPTRVISVIL